MGALLADELPSLGDEQESPDARWAGMDAEQPPELPSESSLDDGLAALDVDVDAVLAPITTSQQSFPALDDDELPLLPVAIDDEDGPAPGRAGELAVEDDGLSSESVAERLPPLGDDEPSLEPMPADELPALEDAELDALEQAPIDEEPARPAAQSLLERLAVSRGSAAEAPAGRTWMEAPPVVPEPPPRVAHPTVPAPAPAAAADGGTTRTEVAISGTPNFARALDVQRGIQRTKGVRQVQALQFERGTLVLAVEHDRGVDLASALLELPNKLELTGQGGDRVELRFPE